MDNIIPINKFSKLNMIDFKNKKYWPYEQCFVIIMEIV